MARLRPDGYAAHANKPEQDSQTMICTSVTINSRRL
jgi:hypothetical protein